MPELQTVESVTDQSPVTPTKKRAGRPKKNKKSEDPDILQISRADLQSLIADALKAKEDATTPTGFSPEVFAQSMDKVLEKRDATATLVLAEALKKNSRPSNSMLEYPGISVYNPLGERDHPRSKLVDSKGRPRITTYGGCPMNTIDTMSEAEILAFNAIQHNAYIPERNWRAEITRKGDAERLDITMGDLADVSVNRAIPDVIFVLSQLQRNKVAPNFAEMFATRSAKDPDFVNKFFDNLDKLAEQL